MLYGAVLGTESSRVGFEALAAAKLLKDVPNNRGIGMKIRDSAAYILLCRVPQQGELGLVGTLNDSFTTHDVQAHRTVVKEVF